jgi:hypothetical protein
MDEGKRGLADRKSSPSGYFYTSAQNGGVLLDKKTIY